MARTAAAPAAQIEQSLRERVTGEVVTSRDRDYDETRAVWNGMIDRRPLAIARARSVADVQAIIETARATGQQLAVRGGGHNVAGFATSEGGIVLDLTPMNSVEVDPEKRLAVVRGGALWQHVDAATQVYGLAAPAGLVSETGVAGLTLGGGLGWLRRKHGLSCDNLLAAELVTADGRLVHADLQENPELLWALRGGGGNFGVVTQFTFAVHPVGPEVAYAILFYDADETVSILRKFREMGPSLPPEMAPVAFTGVMAAGEGIPDELVGRPILTVGGVYVGPPDEGEEKHQRLRELGTAVADFSGRASYAEVQSLFDEEYPRGRRYYWKSAAVSDLSDAVIDIIAEHAGRMPSPLGTIDVWLMGGQLLNEPPGGSAYAGRAAPFLVNPEANWEDPADDEANLRWARQLVAALEPYTVGTYLNFPGLLEDGERQMRSGFGPNYERLAEIKRRWDPDNLFRLNHNIPPAPAGS